MEDKKPVHPARKVLFFAFVIAFFGGGILIFVNNLIVPFLPKGVAEIIGGIVLVLFIVMFVVSKCVTAVQRMRQAAGHDSSGC